MFYTKSLIILLILTGFFYEVNHDSNPSIHFYQIIKNEKYFAIYNYVIQLKVPYGIVLFLVKISR